MQRRTLSAVYRAAFAWFLVSAGALWLAVTVTPLAEITGQRSNGHGYLVAVLLRSIGQPYQGVLLAGLLAVPLHALWVWPRGRNRMEMAKHYAAFSGWMQTIFTSLGFLGTIVGVSLAVAGLQDAMAAGDPGALIAGLSTAFDTTFLGLLAAILLMGLRQLAALQLESLPDRGSGPEGTEE